MYICIYRGAFEVSVSSQVRVAKELKETMLPNHLMVSRIDFDSKAGNCKYANLHYRQLKLTISSSWDRKRRFGHYG